ncbi:hypothetical protein CR513_23306, partial [Mucuna pruriens]
MALNWLQELGIRELISFCLRLDLRSAPQNMEFVRKAGEIVSNETAIVDFKEQMMSEFGISDLGLLSYLLGNEFKITNVGLINKFMQEPKQSHLLTTKRILRYVQGTVHFGVLFPKDWYGDKSDRKNIIGYIFFYGGAPISWSSTKEHVVALSSCIVEYIVASETIYQAVWLEILMKDL